MNLVKRNTDRLEKLTLFEVNDEVEEEVEVANGRVNERTRSSRERIEREGFFELDEDKGLPEVGEDDEIESEPLWSREDEWESEQEEDNSEDEEVEEESEDEAY